MALTETSHLLGNTNLRISTIKQALHRIRWPHVLATLATVGLLGVLAVGVASNLSAEPEMNLLQSSLKSELPELQGVTFSAISGPKDGSSPTTFKLTVRTDSLDAAQLTTFLSSSENYTQNLVSIDIETGSFIGNFTRVYLPNLSEFRLNITEGVEGSGPFFVRDPEGLHQMLFFDKVKSTDGNDSWDMIKDVANLGVVLSVTMKFSKQIEIDRTKGLIELNLDYAWEVIENVKGTYEKLVVVSCPFAVDPADPQLSFPSTLKYLNLFNITNTKRAGPVQLSSFLKTQNAQGLETLIVYEYPFGFSGLQTTINLPDLSKSLKKIAFRGVRLTNSGSSAASTVFKSVTDLTLEDCQFEDGILDKLQEIFPNVKMLNLQNLQGDPNNLLTRAINLKKVQMIFVMALNRTIEHPVNDAVLNSFGVSATAENFVLSRQNKNGKFNGSAKMNVPGQSFMVEEIAEEDAHRKRFDALGFPDFEEFRNYFNSLTNPYVDDD